MVHPTTHPPRRKDVERIVRQVLAELGSGRRSVSTNGESPGELVLISKVVSLADVEGRLGGVSRVVVAPGAVFTPAARDLLRKHNVAIASAVAANTTRSQPLAFGVAKTNYQASPLVTALAAERVNLEQVPQSGLLQVVDELCERVVKQGQLGLLITGQTAAALCLANRNRGVRAALGASVQAVTDAVEAIAANLLVIDPGGISFFGVRRMTREFAKLGWKSCPMALRERLD
jgi:hypothetical protein